MTKRFLGKTCVYCAVAAASTAGDHVFARQFFARDHRGGLPKVPACVQCNTRKSNLEQYVLSTLPLGSRSESTRRHHLDKLPRRLQRNPTLRASLARGVSEHWVPGESGLLERRRAIPLDSAKFEALFAMIARGLAWHHWAHLLEPDVHIGVHLPYLHTEFVFSDANLDPENWVAVSNSLGESAIEYQGWQSRELPSCTFWRVTLLGGVTIGGGPNPAAHTSSVIGIITTPAEFERPRRQGT